MGRAMLFWENPASCRKLAGNGCAHRFWTANHFLGGMMAALVVRRPRGKQSQGPGGWRTPPSTPRRPYSSVAFGGALWQRRACGAAGVGRHLWCDGNYAKARVVSVQQQQKSVPLLFCAQMGTIPPPLVVDTPMFQGSAVVTRGGGRQ